MSSYPSCDLTYDLISRIAMNDAFTPEEGAFQLFGIPYEDINFKIQQLKNTQSKVNLIWSIFVGTGIITSGIGGTLSYLYGLNTFFGTLGSLVGIGGGGTTLVSVLSWFCQVNFIDEEIVGLDAFIRSSHLMANFCCLYEEFVSKPSKEKIQGLFLAFEDICEDDEWCVIIKEMEVKRGKEIISDEQIKLFGPVGKLYLMNEVVKLLPEFEFEWQQLLQDSKLFTVKNAEVKVSPWSHLNVRSPRVKYYSLFLKDPNHDNFVRRITTLFSSTLTEVK